MAQQIYDTLRGAKRPLTPRQAGHVSLYVCGPTVYDHAHVGHARGAVVFDVVARHLRGRYTVTYARNYTDIDDKIVARAGAEGTSAAAVAARYIAAFTADMAALGCLPPDHAPRVTEYVPQVVRMIAALVEGGHAYAAAGDVYYAVERFATYGRLGGRTLADMEAGARVEVAAHKRHPMDFALWKAAKPGEPAWPSPWGDGRPGWHIECSAMADALFGPHVDLHGGGRDLIFPHHENEIAQSEAAGAAPLAQMWMHNGLIHLDGVKMSKSLGNVTRVGELLARLHPQALRLYLLSTHYRAPMHFAEAGLLEAEQRIRYCYAALARLEEAPTGSPPPPPLAPAAADRTDAARVVGTAVRTDAARVADVGDRDAARGARIAAIAGRMDAALDDDFNTPQALAELAELFPLINEIAAAPGHPDEDARARHAIAGVIAHAAARLGLFGAPPAALLGELAQLRERRGGVDVVRVEALVAARAAARAARDFARGDAIRDELLGLGIVLRDGPAGTRWEVGG